MKILNKIKILGLGGAMFFSTTGCWELDQEVLTGLPVDELVVTPELVEVLKQSAYGVVSTNGSWGGHGGIYSVQEVTSDEMAIPQKGADWEDGGTWLRAHRHTWTVADGPYNGTWGYCFGIVAEANNLIVSFPNVPELVAEMKVLRALSYLWLIDNFGNVPIITETSTGRVSQSTRAQVFSFIESSIKENVALLPKNSNKINLNYWTAHMILAKLYLNANVYIGQPKLAEAEAALDVIIKDGPYSLSSNFFANFATKNENSSENMFTLPYDANNNGGFNIHQMTLHYGSQETFDLQSQPWNGYTALEDFYNSFEDGDLRKGSLREGPQFKSDGVTRVIDQAFEAADPDGAPLTFTPNINMLAPNALRQAGTRINKFEIQLGAAPDLNNDFPIFRYADVLLMKAEVLWRSGKTAEALTFVNQVRTRANAPALTTLTADILLAERGRELFAEGWRRSDLIRFGRFNSPWWEKAQSAPTRNLFPIPQNVMQANPGFTQNPGYN